jgi:small subunit ribosomal protein S6
MAGYKPKGHAMPLYEVVLIARQDMTPATVDELAASLTKVIEDGEGKVVKTDNWGLRTLAYRINKNKKGYYVLLNIDAPAPAVLEMERQMRLNEDVLRYMTIRVEEFIETTTEDEEKEAA